MKVFVIVRHYGGHSITVVKAVDEAEALTKYREHLHMDTLPVSGSYIREIKGDVEEVSAGLIFQKGRFILANS